MLVLTRKPEQKFVINPGPDQVVVTVVQVAGGQVRLGVDAPKDLVVIRGELEERKAA